MSQPTIGKFAEERDRGNSMAVEIQVQGAAAAAKAGESVYSEDTGSRTWNELEFEVQMDHPRKKVKAQGFLLDEVEVVDDCEEVCEGGAEESVDKGGLHGRSSPSVSRGDDCSEARRPHNAWRDQPEAQLAQPFLKKYATRKGVQAWPGEGEQVRQMEAAKAAPILRVKRKRGADPVEELVVACKRLRRGASEERAAPVQKNVFKLAATVSSQQEPVHKCIREALSRDKAVRSLTPSLQSQHRIRQRLLCAKQLSRQHERYRLVSSRRLPCSEGAEALPPVDAASSTETEQLGFRGAKDRAQRQSDTTPLLSSSAEEFQVFDIVHEDAANKGSLPTLATCSHRSDVDVILRNSVQMMREGLAISDHGQGAEHRENEDDYVYDIYYTQTCSSGGIESILSVHPYTQEWEPAVFGHQTEEIDDDHYDDDEDENSENHWRNEYPEDENWRSDGESSRGSDEEDSFSDEESSAIRPSKTWSKYPIYVQKEFEYDGFQDFDSE